MTTCEPSRNACSAGQYGRVALIQLDDRLAEFGRNPVTVTSVSLPRKPVIFLLMILILAWETVGAAVPPLRGSILLAGSHLPYAFRMHRCPHYGVLTCSLLAWCCEVVSLGLIYTLQIR